LADHLFQWLPYAALSQENQLAFGSNNFVEMLRLAAAHIYKTKKTATRGEIGELMLHLACILHFKTIPVMCKLVLKTSSNDTVKGFDGVHLLPRDSSFELWLGESKFYTDPQDSIREAARSSAPAASWKQSWTGGSRRGSPAGRQGWLVIPLVGRRGDPIEDLRDAVARAVASERGTARTRRRKPDKSGRDVIERLRNEAVARSNGGVLVVLDEMGKFLEGAACESTDIQFFQELAEAAGRCDW
jgi:hypothetical protein